MKPACIAIICLLLFSCDYKIQTVVDSKGVAHRVKEYNSPEIQRKKELQAFLSTATRKNYDKYQGVIITDTTHGFTFFQYDTTRIYLSKQYSSYNWLFASGLVSAQMIYCAVNSCTPAIFEFEARSLTDNKNIIPEMHGWYRPYVQVWVEELDGFRKKNRRCYMLHIQNAGGYNAILIELVNERESYIFTNASFAQGANVTLFKMVYAEI
jgi:hypothetical protein